MSYNQNDRNKHVRVGNWYEELRLLEETGIRYYPSPADRSTSLLTNTRCIIHSDRMNPKDYKSITKEEYIPPSQRPEMGWRLKGIGPRQRLMESKLKSVADNSYETRKLEAYKESMKVDYTSENHLKFSKSNFKSALIENDPSVRVFTTHSSYCTDTPITLYSDTIQRGEKFYFPASFVGSSNPFRRCNTFTIDARTSHVPSAESNERPRQLPTVIEHQALQGMKRRVIEHVRAMIKSDYGRAVRSIIGSIWHNYSDDELGRRSVQQITKLFEEHYQFQITPFEKHAMLTAYDDDSSGSISLVQFTSLIRPAPSFRRIELIQKAFSRVSKTDGSTTSEILGSMYTGKNLENFLSDLTFIHVCATQLVSSPGRPKSQAASPSESRSYSFDDFYDYYCDVSAEVADDEVFANILSENWNLK